MRLEMHARMSFQKCTSRNILKLSSSDKNVQRTISHGHLLEGHFFKKKSRTFHKGHSRLLPSQEYNSSNKYGGEDFNMETND
jgi:hypothetical protein